MRSLSKLDGLSRNMGGSMGTLHYPKMRCHNPWVAPSLSAPLRFCDHAQVAHVLQSYRLAYVLDEERATRILDDGNQYGVHRVWYRVRATRGGEGEASSPRDNIHPGRSTTHTHAQTNETLANS